MIQDHTLLANNMLCQTHVQHLTLHMLDHGNDTISITHPLPHLYILSHLISYAYSFLLIDYYSSYIW